MFNEERYCDLTVNVGLPNEKVECFRANRVLLARCSEVLGAILFGGTEGSSKEVHLPNCSAAAFQEILRCAYDLGPEISEVNFVDVYRAARSYEIEELQEALAEWMTGVTNSPGMALRALNAAEARRKAGSAALQKPAAENASSAHAHNEDDDEEEELDAMLGCCLQSILGHAEALITGGGLLGCEPSTVELLTKQDSLNCSEETLWLGLLQWGETQPAGSLRQLAAHVRFNVMSSNFFVDNVVPSGVLEPGEVVELLSARTTGRPAESFPSADKKRRAESHHPCLQLPEELQEDSVMTPEGGVVDFWGRDEFEQNSSYSEESESEEATSMPQAFLRQRLNSPPHLSSEAAPIRSYHPERNLAGNLKVSPLSDMSRRKPGSLVDLLGHAALPQARRRTATEAARVRRGFA